MTDLPTRLLRETLRGRMAPAPSSGCIDTERLAAWSDGTLSARERAAAESHASSCARCQALLAAMARTTPPESRRRWWHPSTVGWLVPIAVAAVAVAVWINIPTERLAAPMAQAPPAANPALPTAGSPPTSSAQVPSPTSPAPSISDRRAADSKAFERTKVQPAPPVAGASPREARPDERRTARAAEPARPVFRQTAPAKDAPKEGRDAATAPPPPAAAPVTALPEARAQSSAAGAAPASPSAAPNPSTIAGGVSDQTASRSRLEVMAKASPMPVEIVSPDANVRWRILTPGSIARSTDGGTTWQTQSTGVPATLTAGTAPSPAICWLVGRAGIIVVSADGRTWQRVPFPEGIDLVSIRALDAVNATVTAADGRTFITSDGGKTWRAG
jgi:hypothetical protein